MTSLTRRSIIALVGASALIAGLSTAVLSLSSRTDTSSALASAGQLTVSREPEATRADATRSPETWRRYENAAFRFTLSYPPELVAREYEEVDGAMSAAFEDPRTGEGFQVYVAPYGEIQVSQERFLLDAPSGVMREPTDVMVDGVHATIFFSENSIMGETREVWFIRGGYLYEVVTYKALDAWLGRIMRTWQFL